MISSFLKAGGPWVESKFTAASLQPTTWVCHAELTEDLEHGKHYGFIDLVGLELQQRSVPDVERYLPLMAALPDLFREVGISHKS